MLEKVSNKFETLLLLIQGRFEILSLSGSFLLSESGGQRSRTGGLSVSLAGPDGRVLGGGVAGLLIAASPVQVCPAINHSLFCCFLSFSTKLLQTLSSRIISTSFFPPQSIMDIGGIIGSCATGLRNPVRMGGVHYLVTQTIWTVVYFDHPSRISHTGKSLTCWILSINPLCSNMHSTIYSQGHRWI